MITKIVLESFRMVRPWAINTTLNSISITCFFCHFYWWRTPEYTHQPATLVTGIDYIIRY